MSHSTYKGWTNKETYDVAVIFDNNKRYHSQAVEACSFGSKESKHIGLVSLMISIIENTKVSNMDDAMILSETDIMKVNWAELRGHYSK